MVRHHFLIPFFCLVLDYALVQEELVKLFDVWNFGCKRDTVSGLSVHNAFALLIFPLLAPTA